MPLSSDCVEHFDALFGRKAADPHEILFLTACGKKTSERVPEQWLLVRISRNATTPCHVKQRRHTSKERFWLLFIYVDTSGKTLLALTEKGHKMPSCNLSLPKILVRMAFLLEDLSPPDLHATLGCQENVGQNAKLLPNKSSFSFVGSWTHCLAETLQEIWFWTRGLVAILQKILFSW